MTPPVVQAADARRLLLHGAGLFADPSETATPARVYRRIERMGFVQIDTINVIDRAHHHVLRSRFDDYTPDMLTRLHERERRLFEHWTHDASIIPTVWLPYWRRRFEGYKSRFSTGAYSDWCHKRMAGEPEKVMGHVRSRIEREGPLRARDFEHDGPKEANNWWRWKPQKAALEYMWRVGELTVVARENFHKVYDLTERVFPDLYDTPAPDDEALVEWACTEAMRRLVIATPAEIRRFFAAIKPAQVNAWCRAAVLDGRIAEVLVEPVGGARPYRAWARKGWRAAIARCPAAPRRTRLLSPFDPAIRDRTRTERLFGFDYRFEAFVPAAKRRYGYYVLPLLEGDRLTGRADAKLHRDHSRLEVRGLWWEAGIRPTATRRRQLEKAVDRLARSLGAATWTLPID